MQGQPGRPGWRGLAILFFLRPRGLAAEDDQSEEQQRKDAGGCRGPLRQHHVTHTPTQRSSDFWFEGPWTWLKGCGIVAFLCTHNGPAILPGSRLCEAPWV